MRGVLVGVRLMLAISSSSTPSFLFWNAARNGGMSGADLVGSIVRSGAT